MKTCCCVVALLLVPAALRAQDMPLSQILIPGEEWKMVDGKFEPVTGIVAERPDAKRLIVWGANNKPQAFLDGEGKVVTPEPRNLTNRPELRPLGNDRAFIIQPDKQTLKLVFFPQTDEKIKEIKLPVGELGTLTITLDKSTMLIGDAASKYIWWFRISADGELSAGEKYATLRLRKDETRSEVCNIRLDADRRIYVAMKDGVQVFDPTGRLCGLLLNPSRHRPTAMAFAGEHGDLLLLACGPEIYKRRLNTTWASFKASEKK